MENLWKNSRDLSNSNIEFVLSDVSFYRGGPFSAGSIIWRDARESISERFGYQIFGHTMLKLPYVTKNWACLDCKKVIILDNENNLCYLDNSKIKIYGK